MTTKPVNALMIGLLTLCLLSLSGSPAQGATTAVITPKGQQGCAPGTVVGGPNKVANGDFSTGAGAGPGIDPAAKFTSELPNRGPNTYPADFNGGGFSILTGAFTEPSQSFIAGRPFPGDTKREVAASQTYFYSNPNKDMGGADVYSDGSAILWTQTVTGLTGGTTYNFFAYFDNLLIPAAGDFAVDPKIELLVDGIVAGPPITVTKSPDQWVPVQYSFTTAAGQTSAIVQIRDRANSISGDDFGMTGINLKQCVSGLGVAFKTFIPTKNSDGTYNVPFLVTVKNYGVDPEPLRNLQITSDLTATFVGVTSFQVIAISSASTPKLTVNPGFNGGSNKNLLSGTDALGSGKTATISFTVRIRPGTGPNALGPFNGNVSASASAGSVGAGVVVTDTSTPGTNPDPNGNGDGKDPDEDTDTPIYIAPFKVGLPLIRR